MTYKHDDSETVTKTFGELRAMAAGCKEVSSWMKENMPEVFEPKVEFEILVVRNPEKNLSSSGIFEFILFSKKPLYLYGSVGKQRLSYWHQDDQLHQTAIAVGIDSLDDWYGAYANKKEVEEILFIKGTKP